MTALVHNGDAGLHAPLLTNVDQRRVQILTDQLLSWVNKGRTQTHTG